MKSGAQYASELTRWLDGAGPIADSRVIEDIVMNRYGWTKQELDETPVYVVRNALFMMERKALYDKKHGG